VHGIVAAVAWLGAPAAALAWGDAGHRIVCDIAWHQLEPAARAEVRELLRHDRRPRTLAEACLWPDQVKNRPPFDRDDKTRHYLNVRDPDATAIDLARDCGDRCVVEGIEHYSRVLLERGDEHRSAGQALKFLGHFVGDVHQPLHAGYAHDRGGNDVQVCFTGRCDGCTLHSVWDSVLLARTDRDWWTLSQELLAEIAGMPAGKREAWSALDAPLAWAQESYDWTRGAGAASVYPEDESGCLGTSYYEARIGGVRERLEKAGLRLGRLLNRILAHGGDGVPFQL
jgi:hypothetical protein